MIMKCDNCGAEMVYAYGFIWHYYYCNSCGTVSHPLAVFNSEFTNKGEDE